LVLLKPMGITRLVKIEKVNIYLIYETLSLPLDVKAG
jgi:hypothetical protein